MRIIIPIAIIIFLNGCASQKPVRIADHKKDVLLETNYGNITVRLSDETPLHRDNFLKLVKNRYYNGLLFHRVINQFMIQAGDPDSRKAPAGKPLGNGGPGYTIPAEFRHSLFHKKGVIAAARKGDGVNPERASSGSQFYIVQGKVWTEGGLDTLQYTRRGGRNIPAEHRTVYMQTGGTPHLDQAYTVFGEVVAGLPVIDSIAAVATSKGPDRDRPLEDVVIKKAKLIKRKQ
ncbi:MAG: peptidylprolyl isomerase [Chitinophagaceae bacterium]|nr:peptidylprolyl isomerase [Chitinophagaceae bacterium]MCW5928301.1 peptidylprolyl isomerase [Chitinophagaceae bacterium]